MHAFLNTCEENNRTLAHFDQTRGQAIALATGDMVEHVHPASGKEGGGPEGAGGIGKDSRCVSR